ncbi:MAG: HAMP domain-containing protein [Prevotella sp.]|nr:HAMP domain-containing protein [Prevotella sp.]
MSSFRFSLPTFRSLSARLTFWVMLTVMIVTVIIALIVSYISSSAVLMGTKENVQSRMEIANQHINSVLVGVEVAVANTIPEVENSLSNPDKMYGVVRRLLELNPNIIGSTVAFEPNYYPSKGKQFSPYAYRDIDSTVLTKQLGSNDYEYHYMDWYLIPKLLKRNYWSEPYYDKGGGEQMMTTYSRPLFDASGNIYAIITADVSLEWLTELVTESDLDFNQRVLNIKDQERDAQWAILEGDSAFFYHHAYTYIIGKGGAYITHPLRDRILNESYFILADVTADTIDNRIGYDMIDGKTGMEAVDRDGTKFYINYAPIERTGWSMATVIPAKLIFTRSMIFGGIVVAVMLIGLAILFFICHHILIRVTKPLTLFAKSADEVAQGNLNASLPQILSHDEMKRLHDSFAMMQTSLKEQMEELKQVNETKGRIEGELNAAKDIQMSMLPKLFPAYPDRDDIDIYGQLTSAKEVGGDLFDFFIRDDKLFFCIGDVSGKGIPASLVMAMTRSLFRNIANHESRPEKIVSLINEAMSDGNDSNMFVTFFLGVLDLQTGQLHYCNAGHDWPYLVGNGITELKSDPNLPVGTFSDTVYCPEEYRMPEGTILFMYTDGLTEAQDSQNNLFGDQRIVDVLQTGGSCKEIIAKMTEAVHKFVGDAEQSDDLTMLAIQYKSTTKQ